MCKKPFENIVGKGQNAVHQHLFLFPQCFLPNILEINFNFSVTFTYLLEMLSIWTGLKFCRLVKQLTLPHNPEF